MAKKISGTVKVAVFSLEIRASRLWPEEKLNLLAEESKDFAESARRWLERQIQNHFEDYTSIRVILEE